MKLQGDYRLPAPRALVWRALLDPAILARTLPGCEELAATGENVFAGAMTVTVGPVKGQFKGALRLNELDPPNGYRMQVDGSGPSGFLRGEGTLRLTDAEAGGTLLTYDLDAQIGGRIAGLGQRLLDSSAKVITRQGLEGFERQLAALVASEGTALPAAAPTGSFAASAPATGSDAAAFAAAPVAAPPPPSQAAFAGRFLVGLAGELVPPRVRPWLFAAAGFLAGAATVLLLRGCR